MSITVDVEVHARGTVEVDDSWTDEAIEEDTAGFDEAVLAALPNHLNDLNWELSDAVSRLPEVPA